MSIFRTLRISNWRQFGEVQVTFHPRLTILTGANGAGKTTILHLLNRHWGWNINYVSTPRPYRKGVWRYWSGFWSDDSGDDEWADKEAVHPNAPQVEIGRIEYSGHPPASLIVPREVEETFAVKIAPMPAVAGVYVPSHRPLYLHQKVTEIPTNIDARQQIFEVYLAEIRNRWNIQQRVHSPSYMLKRSLISLATFGYGSEAVHPSTEARQTFEGFQEVLSKILPKTLGFRRLRVHIPDVILETSTGNVAFDAVSGGVSALIDIAWQVFLYSTLVDDFVVAIDEPEAHLHPAMQKAVLPDLMRAFPTAQFIVATHSPLVIGSGKESSVYVLRYNDEQRVVSDELDQLNKAGTANELLRDVLGLETTSAVWVEGTLREIIGKYSGRQITKEMLAELRHDLGQLGLSKYLPDAINKLAN